MAKPLNLPTDLSAYLSRFGLTLPQLLTDDNIKLAKGHALARGVILHHLPGRALAAALNRGNHGTTAPRSYLPGLAELAAANGLSSLGTQWDGCPWATEACRQGCLNWAGHGGLSSAVASARGRRTLAMLADPQTYARAIVWAIARQWSVAQAQRLPLAVRLRGTDEGPRQGWHRLRLSLPPTDVAAIARRFGLCLIGGDVTIADALSAAMSDGTLHLYDYSKAPVSGPLGLDAQRRAGWDVTASFAADRSTAVADGAAALRAGFRLAVPVSLAKGAPIPDRLRLTPKTGAPITVPCVNGDATDHRWADPHGVAVILRTKVSRGASPLAKAFSLTPGTAEQPLADGSAQLVYLDN